MSTKRDAISPNDAMVHVVQQRRDNDCALCALCSVTGIPYVDALAEAAHIDSDRVRNGLTRIHLKKVASAFGITLRVRRKFDLEEDTGILWISSPAGQNDHAVVLKRGQIIDHDGTVTDHDVYFDNTVGVPTALLVVSGASRANKDR